MNYSRLLCVLLSIAGLSSCSSTGPTSPNCSSADSRVYQGPAKRSVPESVWERDFSRPIDGVLDPSLTGKLSAALDSLLAHYPAASVAVALPGQGMWMGARGVARSGSQAAISDTALFQVGSVGKALTAAVVLQLVEAGRIRLADPVAKWLPNVPNADIITVSDLLSHTSGLVSFNALPDGRKLDATYHSPKELMEIVSEYDPQFCPGTLWSYTNTGYVMLGLIIEAIEGKPFNQVLAERLLDPLELNHTHMREQGVELPGVVVGHGKGVPVGEPDVDYATPYAAGALASTAADLVRFWHAFLSGEVIPATTVKASFQEMYPMQPLIPAPPGTGMFYGRGVQFTDAPGGKDGPGLMLEHSGGIMGFNAVVAYLAEDDAYVAVAVNDKDVPAAAGLWKLVQTIRTHRASQGPLGSP